MDNLYDEKTLRKYRIDATEKIYNNLTVKDLKLNQYSSQSNLLGVFPTLPASEWILKIDLKWLKYKYQIFNFLYFHNSSIFLIGVYLYFEIIIMLIFKLFKLNLIIQ